MFYLSIESKSGFLLISWKGFLASVSCDHLKKYRGLAPINSIIPWKCKSDIKPWLGQEDTSGSRIFFNLFSHCSGTIRVSLAEACNPQHSSNQFAPCILAFS
jgi:hypothetical protein